MSEINEYYGDASTSTSDYLAHYGVMGMKWGVRRALKSGNSDRLSRQYAKAQKKLAKLQERAANSSKYAKRAVKLGAGAALAGGIAAEGVKNVASRGTALAGKVGAKLGNAMYGVGGKMQLSGNETLKKIGSGMSSAGGALSSAGVKTIGKSVNVHKAVGDWARKEHDIGGEINAALNKVGLSRRINGKNLGKVSNDTITRIGAGALGAGLAAGAVYNAHRAATAKKKAEKFRAEMNKAFAGTKYGRKSNSGGSSKPRKRRR